MSKFFFLEVEKVTEAIEDYLKALYHLEGSGKLVSNNALAAHLDISPASASGMVKKLARLRLVTHQRYQGTRLTEEGRARALQIIRRHRLAELFLARVLGLPWDLVHAEAHRWEHVLSDEVARRMEDALDHPTHDPHGAPIPTADGQIDNPVLTPLTELPAGSRARIAEVSDHDSELLSFLGQLGLRPGVQVEVTRQQPFAGPLTLRIQEEEIALGIEAARHVFVRDPVTS